MRKILCRHPLEYRSCTLYVCRIIYGPHVADGYVCDVVTSAGEHFESKETATEGQARSRGKLLARMVDSVRQAKERTAVREWVFWLDPTGGPDPVPVPEGIAIDFSFPAGVAA